LSLLFDKPEIAMVQGCVVKPDEDLIFHRPEFFDRFHIQWLILALKENCSHEY
jgi:hypothetical protein